MGKIEFTLPAMGEGIIEATITRWFVKEGDIVREDDPLLEVATDKVDSEVPSPVSGVISRIIYHEGEIPKIGEVLALIDTEENADQAENEISGNERSGKNEEEYEPSGKNTEPKRRAAVAPVHGNSEKLLTPFVRFLAKSRGIPVEELENLRGSGLNGRITKDDINAYIRNGRPYLSTETDDGTLQDQETLSGDYPREEDYSPGPDEELIEMSRTRRLIAEHMVRSKRISPHVTSMVEIDVTGIVQWREKNKKAFEEKHGIRLTYTPMIVEAATRALKDFPGINISVTGNHIIQKKKINIGVATALPDGNLIVPVIKETDKQNFVSLARELADLAARARSGKLQPAEIKGGTFTITNMGPYENISGTPIINQPEVAILAVGAIRKKPGVVMVNGEATIGVRDILILSLTYDHRVVDGALGGSFVRRIGEYLESNIPDF
jgi:2-oxoglutarate dehydrogenase E2 component (dihydrolipoamide succinyltransferase)